MSQDNNIPGEIEEALRNHPLFRRANDDTISRLSKIMKTRVFISGDKIIQEGDEGKAVFFLIKGEVDILSGDEEVVYATLYSGSFFGEIALLKNVNRTANVIARSKCFLLCLHKSDYLDLVNLDFWKQLEEEASVRLNKLNKNRRSTVTDEIPIYNSNVIAENSGSAGSLNVSLDYDLVFAALKKMPIFQYCEDKTIKDLYSLLKTINFQPGDISLNGNSSSAIIILNGIVTSPNQEEKRKGSLIQYEFYGKIILDPGDDDSNETLLALSSGSAGILESEDVVKLMEADPAVKEQIELGLVNSLEHSLDNLAIEDSKPKFSANKSFDTQRLIITSGEKRRASVAVWADPNLSQIAEKKKSTVRSKLATKSSRKSGFSLFLSMIADKPKVFRIITEYLSFKDIYLMSAVCHSLYTDISKMSTTCVNIDLVEFSNSINNSGISRITNLWKYSIRCINLRGCFKITNVGLAFIANNCPNLEILNLHSCWDISSQGLSILSEGCPKLRSIDLSNCRKIDSSGIVALLDNTQTEEIILSYCKSLNNDLYKDPFLFTNLKKLNLQRCTTITDVGYRNLDGHALELEYLALSDCSFLTDATISIICESCPNLKLLSVSFVCGLTEKSIDSIIKLVRLETLDVSFCGNLMTNNSLEQIRDKLVHLKRLAIRGCFKISQEVMVQYLTDNSVIECLNVSQCKGLSMDYLKRNFQSLKYLDCENIIDFDPLSRFMTTTKYPIGVRQRTKTI